MCGLVRDAVAEQLLQWGENFIGSNSLVSLADFSNNPSVVGFMIEHAILSSIRSNGLAIGAGIMKPMKVKLLTEPSDIETDIRNQPVLYWPRKFNFKATDGIIVLIDPEELSDEKDAKMSAKKSTKKSGKKSAKRIVKKTQQETSTEDAKVEKNKLLMFPLQITLNRLGHSDSHEKFFKEHRKWTKHLSNFDVEIEFIWITPSDRGFQMHQSSLGRPAHKERYIPFEDISTAIWEKYQDATREADEARGELTVDEISSSPPEVTADEKSSSLLDTTADEKSSLLLDTTADEKSSSLLDVTAGEKSSSLLEVAAGEKSSSPPEVAADEKSSPSPEVTAAAPSSGRVLRPRPDTRHNKRR